MLTDRKDNEGKPNREIALTELAEKIKTASDIEAKTAILTDLITKRDEEALIWLYRNKIIDVTSPLRSRAGGGQISRATLLNKAISNNLLLFIEDILKNSPEIFTPISVTPSTHPLPDKDLPYYKNRFVDWAVSAEMVGLFIKYLPDYNINQCTPLSETILWKFASQGKFIDVVKLVLLYNANVNCTMVSTSAEIDKPGTRQITYLLQFLAQQYIKFFNEKISSSTENKEVSPQAQSCLEIIRFLASRGASTEGMKTLEEKFQPISFENVTPASSGLLSTVSSWFFAMKPTYKEVRGEIPESTLEAIKTVKETIAEGQALGPTEERYKKLLEVNTTFGLSMGLSDVIYNYESKEADIVNNKNMKKGF